MQQDLRANQMKWKTEVVASLYSGRLLCNFSDMHEFAQWLVGEPIFTTQFAHRAFVNQVQAKVGEQVPGLADFPFSDVTPENWESMRDQLLATMGPELEISRGGGL